MRLSNTEREIIGFTLDELGDIADLLEEILAKNRDATGAELRDASATWESLQQHDRPGDRALAASALQSSFATGSGTSIGNVHPMPTRARQQVSRQDTWRY